MPHLQSSTDNLGFAQVDIDRLRRQGVRHVLTHRVLMADFYVANLNSRPTLPDDYIWIDEKELDKLNYHKGQSLKADLFSCLKRD